jgi:integrase/recombinase XerD
MSIVIPRTAFERAALRYIRHHRALHKAFAQPAWLLGRLAKFLDKRGLTDLDAGAFEAWLQSQGHTSGKTRRREALVIYNFCLYRRRSEPNCFVPDPLYFPRSSSSIAPVILGPAEIGRVLETIEAWPSHGRGRLPLHRQTYRVAIILLYTAGLRLGELARLTLPDVDLTNQTLRIRESKFHKTRILPLSPSAAREIRAYLKVRLAPPWDISANAPLLGDHHGSERFRAYNATALGMGVRKFIHAAGVCDPYGRYPRVHDLRHSFAVQALLRWYRQGADVQAKLPQLSMYLGHVSIVSTAYYLHFIPEIAGAAHRRFARYFGALAQGGVL